jgi:DNA sulfur modification protein DndC
MSKDTTLTLSGETLAGVREAIQRHYLSLNLPWIIGVSQGKDSTACAQLVWESIAALPAAQRTKPIHVVMGDTRTETPLVVERIALTKRLMEQAALEQAMPLAVHIAQPAISEGILVRIIGYGYAAPTVRFRHCVERAKINPIARTVRGLIGPHGRAIQVLGSRRSESANRAASIKRYALDGYPFGKGTVRGIYIYTPIVDWTTTDVWIYLAARPSPWGGPQYNRDLMALYRASDAQGECPLVMDKSSPACGTGRFGCWLCTVAAHNRSLYSFVEANEWAEPLVESYEFLKQTTDPAQKAVYRDPKVMSDGRIKMLSRDPRTPTPGKYKLAVRMQLLQMVLAAQTVMRRDGPESDLTLLRLEDVRAIRHLWRQHPDYPRDGSDPARAIAQRAASLDLGPWSLDDVRLLDLPRAQPEAAAAEQLVLSLFE